MGETEDDNEESTSFKIIILGNGHVGKTSYILRFCDNKFDDNSLTTIGIDTKNKYIKRRNKKIELNIWDTAGQDRFKALAKNSVKGADGVILMYAVNDRQSFNGIKYWLKNIRDILNFENIGIIIVGNKCELPKDEIEVDDETKNKLKSKENIQIIDGSAKEDINVTEAFTKLVDQMLDKGLGKVKKKIGEEEEDKNIKLTDKIKAPNQKGGCCGKKG